MRRLTRTVAAATLATALALVSACSSDSDKADDNSGAGASLEQVTYLTSFGNFGRDAYAWVAKEKGFFSDAGFEVEIKPGQGTGAVIRPPARMRIRSASFSASSRSWVVSRIVVSSM
ncbi:ABC transporter substrate-binding protein, partial [Micromonospora sp. NPDC051296]|uniref:ABC transporter substrate-binding protein n=1 Tax=Micromonospora sp. NPDC051296 TaxID=3155046 RepID=UPI00343052FE